MGKIFRKLDKPLLIITSVMFAFGFVAIFSASYVKASFVNSNAFYYFFRQAFVLIICIVVFLVVLNTSMDKYKKYIKIAMYAIILALILLFPFGKTINGATSWFDLGFFNLQPSEVAKVLLIIFLGVYFDKYKNSKDIVVAIKPLLFAVTIIILIALQPDLGTVMIILLLTTIMFISIPINAKIKRKIFLVAVSGIVVLGCILAYLHFAQGKTIIKPYQLARFNILNPCKRYTESGTGYQVCNGYIAINNGGLFGVGIGDSTQKYLYLPEAHTDFIFPIIIEEFGLIVSCLILLMYFIIIYRIFLISRRSTTLMGSIICYGVACFIFLHIFVNLGGVFGLIPLTGVPLPFLSYGGTFTMVITISLAIVQRICYEDRLKEQSKILEDKIKEI